MSVWLPQSALLGWAQQLPPALASSGVLLHGLALAQEDKARSCSRLCCGGLGPRVGLGVKDRADWMWA